MNHQAPPSPFVSDVADQDSERIDLDSEKYSEDTKARHIKRYAWAITKIHDRFVRAGRVIDFACGTGYGSAMLATVAHEVYGRDKDVEAIRVANARHSSTLVNFKVRDRIERHACVCKKKFEDPMVPLAGWGVCTCAASVPFDAVVSIETIEHLDPATGFGADEFLAECQKLIIPQGLLVLSTPLQAPDGRLRSKFHLKEYTVDEINALVERHGFGEIRHDDVLPGFICLTARRLA